MWCRRSIKIIAKIVVFWLCSFSVSADIVYFENPAPGKEGHFNWQIQIPDEPQIPENWLNITRPSTEQFEMLTGNSIGQLFYDDDVPNVTRFGAEAGQVPETVLTRAFEFGEEIASAEFDDVSFHVVFEGDIESDFEEGVLLYMGVHIENDNYGWIAVIRTGQRFRTTGWAYETTPGKTILAGEIPAPGALAPLFIFTLGGTWRGRRRR